MKIPSKKRLRCFYLGILVLILFLLLLFIKPYKLLPYLFYEPREGDIIFQSLPHMELVDAIEGATQSPWSHCGIVMKENDRWVVYEAGRQVCITPLSIWVLRGRDFHYSVYRCKDTQIIDTEKLRTELKSYLGRPYDIHYAPEDNEIYCSELVYKAYDRALGIQIGQWQTLESLDWKPFEPFILKLEGHVPLDREMITPVELTRSPVLECIN